jgi:hypothetical protein
MDAFKKDSVFETVPYGDELFCGAITVELGRGGGGGVGGEAEKKKKFIGK